MTGIFSARQVVGGWCRHTWKIHLESQGLPTEPDHGTIRFPTLTQTRYGGPTPEPADDTDVAQWLIVEKFFRLHIHLHLFTGALLAKEPCEGFWAEFEPWYYADPLRKRFPAGSPDESVKLTDAAGVWNLLKPEDPITYDALRKAKSGGVIVTVKNADGWDMVTMGEIARWRASCKHGGKRDGAGRKPQGVAA